MDAAAAPDVLDGVDVVRLRAGDLDAAVAPGVGMVVASLRQRGEEVLGQRDGLRGYAERGRTFGVPLLHPWANRLRGQTCTVADQALHLDPREVPVRLDAHGLPIHGLLGAAAGWEVAETSADADGAEVVATFAFDERPELLRAFPFPHQLALTHRLDAAGLQSTLTVLATGGCAVPISFGFHPYLAPGGSRQDWLIELPVLERAVLDDRGLPTGARETAAPGPRALGDDALDDLYTQLEPEPVFAVETAHRRLEVAFGEGFPCAQVYAPRDLDVVCFEPMTAPTDALVSGVGLHLLPPGGTYTATFRIDVLEP